MPLLEIENVSRRFGGLTAVNGVSFRVRSGQIKAVIGPNGAGKTTLFHVISGMLPPSSGRLRFDGIDITGWPPHRIARLGVSRTFQTLSLFSRMTALENVMIGRHCRTRSGLAAAALRLPAQRREERQIRERAAVELEAVGLAAAADRPVGALSFGQRRLVELARALATEPRLLLLDEPASGLNTREKDDLADILTGIRRRGVTLLLVEHDMSFVMQLSDEVVVLHHGARICEGPPEAVRRDERVMAVYLGGGLHAQG